MKSMETAVQSPLDKISLYQKERFSWVMHLVLPLFLMILGSQTPTASLFVWTWFGILFFRVFDDLFCFELDVRMGKKHQYLKEGTKPLVIYTGILWFLYLSGTLIFTKNMPITMLTSLFIIMHIPFYLLLRRNYHIQVLSLLKYPFMLFALGYMTGAQTWTWAILGSTFLIARELIELYRHKRNQAIEMFIFAGLLFLKLGGNI